MPYSLRTRTRQPLAPLDLPEDRPTLKRSPSSTSLRSPQKHSKLDPPPSPGPSSMRSQSVRRSGGMEGRSGSVTPRMSLSKMMGMGEKGMDGARSPARRLFGPETPTSGISGAIITPPRLAPSPPMDETTSSPFVVLPTSSSNAQNLPNTGAENGQDGQHDPGFVILPDPKGNGKGKGKAKAGRTATTPTRLRRGRSRSRSVAAEDATDLPPLASENQENIPPPPPVPSLPPHLPEYKSKLPPSPISHPSLSRSTTTTTTSPSSSPSSSLLPPPMAHSASWSGTPGRRRERSKLVNELLMVRGETEMPSVLEEQAGLEEGDELTPGKRVLRSTRGKQKLAEEVDQL
ncbi:hypothetical protein I350_06107 [Cryptococcus amylolentus CBS 6273]|uniref:Uncharacterized protein n=1 Tax=Cryptococcus amylolentus CBS 6273 TaxID=1296118 RepID=A0A1E3JQV2_9TREE|nr:hypothetical protein I350_06107 [Cryptococcus amylolentus CBS 6273]